MNYATDYYAILGVLPTAEDIVIRAAYKALAQRYHPDRFEGSQTGLNRKMAEINEACSVLSDPVKRKEYDAQRAKVSEGDAYFDDKSNEPPPEYDPLEKKWKTAVSYYPDLQDMENALAQIAWRLAYAYRAYLLESKDFAKRDQIASTFEQNFLESYFGKNPRIIDFARKLINRGQRGAARELNKAVRLFGNNIEPELVIARINVEFNDPIGEVRAKEEKEEAARRRYKQLQKERELNEKPDTGDGCLPVVKMFICFLVAFMALLFILTPKLNAPQMTSYATSSSPSNKVPTEVAPKN